MAVRLIHACDAKLRVLDHRFTMPDDLIVETTLELVIAHRHRETSRHP